MLYLKLFKGNALSKTLLKLLVSNRAFCLSRASSVQLGETYTSAQCPSGALPEGACSSQGAELIFRTLAHCEVTSPFNTHRLIHLLLFSLGPLPWS